MGWHHDYSRPGEGEIWLVYSVLTDPDKKSYSGKLCKRKKLFICISLVKQRSLQVMGQMLCHCQRCPKNSQAHFWGLPQEDCTWSIHSVVSDSWKLPSRGGSWVFPSEPEHVLTHWTFCFMGLSHPWWIKTVTIALTSWHQNSNNQIFFFMTHGRWYLLSPHSTLLLCFSYFSLYIYIS